MIYSTHLAQFLDELGLPGVREGRVLILVPAQGVAGVEAVHAEVTQQRLEEVILGRVLEQVGLEAVCADLGETRVIMDYIKCNCYCKLQASRLEM